MGEKRGLIQASWRSSARTAAAEALTLTAPSCAGQYYELSGGSADVALSLLPAQHGAFWTRVRRILEEVGEEDRAERTISANDNVGRHRALGE